MEFAKGLGEEQPATGAALQFCTNFRFPWLNGTTEQRDNGQVATFQLAQNRKTHKFERHLEIVRHGNAYHACPIIEIRL